MTEQKNINICLISLGCPKNLVDSEIMLGQLQEENFNLIVQPEDAHVIIVNTCGFIDSAKEEAINTILEMAKYKEDKCKSLIVTGCLAQRYPDDIKKDIPEVDFILGVGNYSDIVYAVNSSLGNNDKSNLNGEVSACSILCSEIENLDYLNDKRIISTPKTYAYLKIAEGCDNRCTYCVIPYIRGSYISRRKEAVLKEAEFIIGSGYKEIILVAQDTTKYGEDLYGEYLLHELLKDMCNINGDFKIRILYCYPDKITDDLIDIIANNDKICKYIDIPIQHGSDKILKAMGRKSDSGEIKETVNKLRKAIPDIYIRTSLITGFPGETNGDHKNLKSFLTKLRFDRAGVFEYSKQGGTKAAIMDKQVPADIIKKRMNEIMELQRIISKEINEERLGNVYDVIVEGVAQDNIFYFGRTYAEAPDIDGLIYFTAKQELKTGDNVKVKILNADDYDLTGEQII